MMYKKVLFVLLMCVCLVSLAHADLLVTNGDFEADGDVGAIDDVGGWCDASTGSYWESAWLTNFDGVTPNGTNVVVFCSWNTAEGDPLTGSYLYQSIGTLDGETELTISFDWGHPDDTAEGRHDGLVVSVLASDGSFVADDANDVLNAAGVTLLDYASYDHVAEGTDGEIWTQPVTLDLSGANAGDEIFLRFNNYLPNADADPWPVLDNVQIISPPGPKIVWVTETADRDEDGVQDDYEFTDRLTAAGYDVEIQPDRYLTMGDEKDPNDANDYVAELNAADVVIISRTASSGGYNNDANEIAAWASVTAPMISLSAYHVRSSRLQWIDSTTVNRSLDTYILSLDEGHAIFEDVALEDGLVEMLFTEGFAAEYMGNCVIGSLDAGNGTVIAQTFSDETVIAEWPAGVAGYDGADVVQAGPRLLLCAGTQDTAGAVGQGEWNLSAAGEKMFFNAVDYMISLNPAVPDPATLTHSYTFEDGTAADSVGGADGTLVGDAAIVDGVLVTDGDDDCVELPGDVIAINTYEEITLELWAQEDVDNPFTGTASFGGTWDNGTGKDYIMLSVGRGDNMNRIMVANTPDSTNPWEDEVGVSSPEIVDGVMHHYVATITADTLAYYIDGELIGTTDMGTTTIAGLSNDFVYLGKGVYSVDAAWAGSIEEFNIYNKALSAAEVAYLAGL